MGFSDISDKYYHYLSKKSTDNHIISNMFFLAYGSPDELGDKDVFRFFNSRQVAGRDDYNKNVNDANLQELIKNIFNMSCEKISVVPKIFSNEDSICYSVSVSTGKETYFNIINSHGSCVGVVLVSGLSGELFNKYKENSFRGVVSTELASPLSAMSLKIIHSLSSEIDFDILNNSKKEKPYSLNLSLLSGGKSYDVKLITGTLGFCNYISTGANRELLIKNIARRGAFLNSLKIKIENPAEPEPNI